MICSYGINGEHFILSAHSVFFIQGTRSDLFKLNLVKAIHTLIWLFFNVVIGYLVYAVSVGRIDKWVWICIGLIALEGIVLLIYKRVCPITIVARKYSTSQSPNFDIYLPAWLARYNKEIYSLIVILALILLVYRIWTHSSNEIISFYAE